MKMRFIPLSLILFLLLCACSKEVEDAVEMPDDLPVAEVTDNAVSGEEAVQTDTTVLLSALVASVGENTVFYAREGSMASYFPDDLLERSAEGVICYGESALLANSLLCEYTEQQQARLYQLISQLDPAWFSLTNENTLRETAAGEGFHTWFKGTDGHCYRFTLFPDAQESAANVVLWVDAFPEGTTAYYYGPYDAALYDGLDEMFDECRLSDEPYSGTAYVTLPGESEPRTLARWLNVRLVNMVEGIVMSGQVSDADTSGCDIQIEIAGAEYRVDRENGIVLCGTEAFVLPENQAVLLSALLQQL